MIFLKTHLEKNNYIWDCPNCHKGVYEYIGKKPIEVGGRINADDFRSIAEGIPNPQNGHKMICPFCRGDLGWDNHD